MAGASPEGGDVETLVQVAPWVLLWQAVYWLAYGISSRACPFWGDLCDKTGEEGYFASSVASTIHAIVITPVSLYVLARDPFLLSSDEWVGTTAGSQLACTIFFGYILSDTIVALYYNTRWPGSAANLAHHAMVSVTWFQLTSGCYGQGLALLLQAMEFTTPFVNARWFLDKAGMKTGSLYIANGLTMLFGWFLCRILGYVYAAIRLVAQWPSLIEADVPITRKCIFVLCFVLGFALQSFWFTKMARGAIKVLFPTSRHVRCDTNVTNLSIKSHTSKEIGWPSWYGALVKVR